MAWIAEITGRGNDKATSYLFISMLIILMLMALLSSIKSKIYTQKNLHQSQFTLPPSSPFLPASSHTTPLAKKRCDTTASTLKAGIDCFNHQFFTQAKFIFQRIRKQAISSKNSQRLLSSHLYLALIAIEEGDKKTAKAIIQHLFFLRSDFSLKRYGVDKKKYFNLFKKIKKQGRNLRKIEINEITKKKFIRVKFCSNSKYCKDGVWLETMAYKPESNFNTDLDCSLRGDCDSTIDDVDLDCSLDGTC